MGKYKYIDRVKFGSYSIGRSDYPELVKFVRENKVKKILEFGPGGSTWAFLENDCEIYSGEFSRDFYKEAREEFKDFPNVHLIHLKMAHHLDIPKIKGKKFDLCFVDAPVGRRYLYFSRLNTCLYAMQVTDTIILHDAHRTKEQMTIRFLKDMGWEVEFARTIPSRLAVCRRVKNYKVPNGCARRPVRFRLPYEKFLPPIVD